MFLTQFKGPFKSLARFTSTRSIFFLNHTTSNNNSAKNKNSSSSSSTNNSSITTSQTQETFSSVKQSSFKDNQSSQQHHSKKQQQQQEKIKMGGIFAVNKPSGPSSAEVVSKIKYTLNGTPLIETSRAWYKEDKSRFKQAMNEGRGKNNNKWSRKKAVSKDIKVGHGGTLDPLASGVLVIGYGDGTRDLQGYLTGKMRKVYECTAIFGASTTTYDITGDLVEYASTDSVVSKVTESLLEDTIKAKFLGDIIQYPPVYSAIKMDGRALYDYARSGEPLPRKIAHRESKVDMFSVVPNTFEVVSKAQLEADKELPEREASEQDRAFYAREMQPPVPDTGLSTASCPDSFVRVRLEFDVSSGTYIRSLVHDLARELGSFAYMSKLVRKSVGPFELGKNVFEIEDLTERYEEESWVKMLETMATHPTKEITIDMLKETIKPIPRQPKQEETKKSAEKIDNTKPEEIKSEEKEETKAKSEETEQSKSTEEEEEPKKRKEAPEQEDEEGPDTKSFKTEQ